MNRYVCCVLLFVQLLPNPGTPLENNGNKLGDVMKNHTKSMYNATKSQNETENLLKQETHKLLRECGVETSDSNSYDDDYNNRRSNKPRRDSSNDSSNRRRSPNRRYNNHESSEYNNRYSNRNRNDDRYDSNRRNNGYRNENYSDEDESDESSDYKNRRFNRSKDCKEDRNQWSNSDGNSYDGRNYGSSGSSGYSGYGGYTGGGSNTRRGVSAPGYSRNFDENLRAKRSSNSEDSQCISQCVFGYLEVLDDNRVPSETLVVKWLQDRLSNDMKRIRALREARRCFARLSTSDVEDGCEFSQSLSKCLNLELE